MNISERNIGDPSIVRATQIGIDGGPSYSPLRAGLSRPETRYATVSARGGLAILAALGLTLLIINKLRKRKLILKSKKPIEEKEEKVQKLPTVVSIKGIEKKPYETELDLVYKMVDKYGKIKMDEIAKKFKVDIKKIEEWAQILEENELIKIIYPAIGSPILTKWKK